MELVDDPSRPPVANLEPALQQRRRPLVMVQHNLRRLSEELVAIANIRFLALLRTLLERLALTDRLQNVRLGFHRLLEHEPLRLVCLPPSLALIAIPLH